MTNSKPTKANNEWGKEFDKLFSNKVLLGYEPPTISLKDFISKTLQQQREEKIERVKKLMDKDMAKKLGDNLKIYWGKRYCPICGCYPEKQRKIILKIMEKK